MEIIITKYCRIKDRTIIINGEKVFEHPEAVNYNEFIRAAYKFTGITYPKFYKMDSPCKLALVAAELLLKETGLTEKYSKEQIGVVLQNASSTFDTDLEFQKSIDDRTNYFPSPAVFVYTLPNIMIGEICIRHKIFGENALFIEPGFKPESLCRHINMLFEGERVKAVVAGWVEQNMENYDAFMYLGEIGGSDDLKTFAKHNTDNIVLKFNN